MEGDIVLTIGSTLQWEVFAANVSHQLPAKTVGCMAGLGGSTLATRILSLNVAGARTECQVH